MEEYEPIKVLGEGSFGKVYLRKHGKTKDLVCTKDILFAESKIMTWLVQITLGLHYMHTNRILHRDIKTQNVFILSSGKVVLGDHGISKIAGGYLIPPPSKTVCVRLDNEIGIGTGLPLADLAQAARPDESETICGRPYLGNTPP